MSAPVLFENALTTAPMLLNYNIVYESPAGRISGRIVETEAYTQDDPASHSFRGQTVRNAAMFEAGGTIYIYFTYGMHYCMNFVCGPVGRGDAVLIRALEPIDGIEQMRINRGIVVNKNLTNGPAKLVQALGIDKTYNGLHLNQTNMVLEPAHSKVRITRSSRIGVSRGRDVMRRFYIANNPYVSQR